MKFYKSLWFWFSLVWLGGWTAAYVMNLEKIQSYHPWDWIVLGCLVLIGVTTALFLRQRALVRMLALPPSSSESQWEETWTEGLSKDLQVLFGEKSDYDHHQVVLGLGGAPEAWKQILQDRSFVSLNQKYDVDLSGEFNRCFQAWLSKDFLLLLPANPAQFLEEDDLARPVAYVLDSFRKEDAKVLYQVWVAADCAMEKIQSKAQSIQSQMAAVASYLSVEFPVYVLYYGMEALSGGQDVSHLLTRMNFHESDVIGKSSQSKDSLADAFAQRLEGFMRTGLAHEVSPAQIYRFSQSLDAFELKAADFTKELFAHFVGKEKPFLQGQFLVPLLEQKDLSSVPLTAASDDPFMGEAVFEEDAPAEKTIAPKAAPKVSSTHSFALLDFLSQEPRLTRYSRFKQRQVAASGILMVLVMVMLGVGVILASFSSRSIVESMRQDWDKAYTQVPIQDWPPRNRETGLFDALDQLTELRSKLEEERPWSVAPGYFSMGKRIHAAEALYDSLARRLMLYSFKAWENRLKVVFANGVADSDVEVYSDLRDYLRLASQGREAVQEGKVSQDSLLVTLQRVIAYSLLGTQGLMEPNDRHALEKHTLIFAERILKGDSLLTFVGNEELIQSVRSAIIEHRSSSGNYMGLLAAADSLPSVKLDTLGLHDPMICRSYEVPGAFTRRGYLEAILPRLQSGGQGGSDWVLAHHQDAESGSLRFRSEQNRQLLDRYFEDYEAHWRQLLDSMSCETPRDPQRIASSIQLLSSPRNPTNPAGIRHFLAEVTQQLNLIPAKDSSQVKTSAMPKKAASLVNRVNRATDAVQSVLPDRDKRAKQLMKSFERLFQLHERAERGDLDGYFRDLGELSKFVGRASAEDKGTVDFIKGIVTGDRRNSFVHAWNEAEALSQETPMVDRHWFSTLFMIPLKDLGTILLPMARPQLQQQYKELVYDPYNSAFRGAFPVDPYASSKEVSVDDLDRYFNPQRGAVKQFINAAEGFIALEGNRILVREWNGFSLPLGSKAISGLHQIQKITDALYPKGFDQFRGIRLTLSLHPASRATVSLDINGTTLQVGPHETSKQMVISWPVKNSSGVILKAETQNNVFTEEQSGEWALLRLIAPQLKDSNPKQDLIWSFQDRSYIIDVPLVIRANQNWNPLTSKDFFLVNLDQNLFDQ